MRVLRRLAPLVVVVCAALLATGCFDAVLEIRVNENGSGSQRVELQIHREFLEFLASFGAELAEGFGAGAEELPAPDIEAACREMLGAGDPLADLSVSASRSGASVESETDASACRTSMQVYWDADAGETVLADLFADGGDTSLQRLPDGGWRFESTSAVPGEASGDEFDPAMLEELGMSAPTMRLSITLPGRPLRYDADEVSGGLRGEISLVGSGDPYAVSTFRWDIDLLDPGPGIFAETTPDTSSPSWAWIVVVAAVAGLLILALLPWWLPRLRGIARTRLSPADDGQPDSLDGDDIREPPPAS